MTLEEIVLENNEMLKEILNQSRSIGGGGIKDPQKSIGGGGIKDPKK